MDAAEQIKKFQEYFETNCKTELMESIRKGNIFFVIDLWCFIFSNVFSKY